MPGTFRGFQKWQRVFPQGSLMTALGRLFWRSPKPGAPRAPAGLRGGQCVLGAARGGPERSSPWLRGPRSSVEGGDLGTEPPGSPGTGGARTGRARGGGPGPLPGAEPRRPRPASPPPSPAGPGAALPGAERAGPPPGGDAARAHRLRGAARGAQPAVPRARARGGQRGPAVARAAPRGGAPPPPRGPAPPGAAPRALRRDHPGPAAGHRRWVPPPAFSPPPLQGRRVQRPA